MRESDDLKFLNQSVGHKGTDVGSLARKFPVSETAKALVRVTPYNYHDPWIQEAFVLYDALTPSMLKIIGFLVMWRIFKISALMENAAKYAQLLRDAVSCYFLIGYFPRIFEMISLQIQDMQERILDFHVSTVSSASSTTLLEMKPALGVLSILVTLASAPFLGPFSFIISGIIALTWALPIIFFGLFHFGFLLGICVLIFLAPIVIISSLMLEQGIALSFFFWMLISSMIWPLLWAGIGRLAFIGLGDMNLFLGFLYTLVVGVMQCAAPIIFIKMMRGVNPGESFVSLGSRIGSTAASMAMSAPIGAIAAPALGMISGARAFMSGARLGGSAPSSGGFIGRVASGMKAFRETASAQSESSVIPSLSKSASGDFQPVKHLGRAGDHIDRAKSFLRGVNRPTQSTQPSAPSKNQEGQKKEEKQDQTPLYQNPGAYGLTLRDLSRYGMLRSAEKQANRWHQGTLAFLSARQASAPIQKNSSKVPLLTGHQPSLQIQGEGPAGAPSAPVTPSRGPLHPKGSSKVRSISYSPNREENGPIKSHSQHLKWEPTEFSFATPQGTKKVTGYTAYSKKTGIPKAHYYPKQKENVFQEESKARGLGHDES